MQFNIKCEVWGGPTGHRESLLKDNGVVVVIDDVDTACQRAAQLCQQMNHPGATASFRYLAVPVYPLT